MRKRAALANPLPAQPPVAVDPVWLEWIPAADVMAVFSVALEPGEPFWDSAFAVADRVDRALPSRAALAPLRTRLNLLAAAAGTRPEIDLWPHLRGVTTGVMADPDRPGAADRRRRCPSCRYRCQHQHLVIEVLPRLASLLTAQKSEETCRIQNPVRGGPAVLSPSRNSAGVRSWSPGTAGM